MMQHFMDIIYNYLNVLINDSKNKLLVITPIAIITEKNIQDNQLVSFY